jgi:hypothetical protein
VSEEASSIILVQTHVLHRRPLRGRRAGLLVLAPGWAVVRRFGVQFSGPFDEAIWRNTLAQMDAIAGWMKRRQAR